MSNMNEIERLIRKGGNGVLRAGEHNARNGRDEERYLVFRDKMRTSLEAIMYGKAGSLNYNSIKNSF